MERREVVLLQPIPNGRITPSAARSDLANRESSLYEGCEFVPIHCLMLSNRPDGTYERVFRSRPRVAAQQEAQHRHVRRGPRVPRTACSRLANVGVQPVLQASVLG
jgi:hypothetical protein